MDHARSRLSQKLPLSSQRAEWFLIGRMFCRQRTLQVCSLVNRINLPSNRRKPQPMKRRTAAGLLVAGGSALVAGVVGIPALIAGLSPAWQVRPEMWRPIGPLRNFPQGKVSPASVPRDHEAWPRRYGELLVFVWRPMQADLVVYSRNCTDLGCPLEYEPGSGCFLCPCHGGIFAQDGQRLAGPPKTPMNRYAHRVQEDVLEIDLASIPPAG
jgi:menaquinol-cytochrome c reductase iron-sulfur subunit